MRIDCSGRGSPAIILDAGLGNDRAHSGAVCNRLAKTTRVCSTIEPASAGAYVPPPRDADHIAAELHGVAGCGKHHRPGGPHGHSIAGMYIRDYATRYPETLRD